MTAAQGLVRAGYTVKVLDKGRGPGGRLSTRRGRVTRLDHGCQFLGDDEASAMDDLNDWRESGVAQAWSPRLGPGSGAPKLHGSQWLVGVPTMSQVAKSMAADLDVTCGCRVGALQQANGQWQILDDSGVTCAEANMVVIAVPAPQAIDLLEPTGFDGLSTLTAATYDPTWALLLEGDELPPLPFDATAPADEPLGWLAVQASKPGRSDAAAWVGLATTQWSRTHLEDEHEAVAHELVQSCERIVGHEISVPATVHRWRYSLVSTAAGMPAVMDARQGLVACGDWCLGPTVSHAVASGRAAAAAVIEQCSSTA